MSQRKQIVGVVVLCALAFFAGRMQAGEAVAQAQGSALTALDYQELSSSLTDTRRDRYVLQQRVQLRGRVHGGRCVHRQELG